MNEPIEHAHRIHGKTTAKQLLDVCKYGYEALSLHGDPTEDRASYSDSFTFEIRARKNRDDKEARTLTGIAGYVSNGQTSHRVYGGTAYSGGGYWRYDEGYRPTRGFWYLSGCPRDRLMDVLSLLPKDATVAFYVYLDAGTNELCVRADSEMEQGLHGDHLYLKVSYMVRGKEKQSEFLIDVNTSAHNSGRFGSPRHNRDQGDTAWFHRRESAAE
jgi:hypothetical protein